MKQLLLPRYGPPSVLEVRDAPDPPVVPHAVRIRVAAAGLNFADLLARQGLYPDAPKPPCVLGYEVAGIVDGVGTGVVGSRIGDRVIALTRFGGQSDVVVVPETQMFPLPSGWTFEQGAALPVTYLTAHHMLARVAAARTGETVLVHAAAGGVGIAVAELGRILGLRVLGLASSSKHEALRSYGVEPIDRTDTDWPAAVRRFAPRGVDVVLDAVGGASWRRGYALLAPAGRLVCYGVSELSTGLTRNILDVVWKAVRWPRFGPVALMNDNRAVAGVNLGHLWTEETILRPQIEQLLAYAREGKIRPRVDRAFPVTEAAAAHNYIHERRNVGKVVLTFDSLTPNP